MPDARWCHKKVRALLGVFGHLRRSNRGLQEPVVKRSFMPAFYGFMLPWYHGDDELESGLPPEMRRFFERYTGLQGAELDDQFLRIRFQAWIESHHPDYGSYWFSHGTIRKHPYYLEVVKALQKGKTLIELEAGLGHNLRYLADDGAPTANMIALDSNVALWNLGSELFEGRRISKGDRRSAATRTGQSFDAKFVHLNFTQAWNERRYHDLRGQADIIMANHVWNDMSGKQIQELLSAAIAPLTKPGSIFMGLQFGAEAPFRSQNDQSFFDSRGLRGHDFTIVAQRGLSAKDPRDQTWKVVANEAVHLRDWGIKEGDLDWIKNYNDGEPTPKLHGVFFALERIK